MADKIIGTCNECKCEITCNGIDLIYCSKCYENAVDERDEALADADSEPEYGVCRRCANVRYLNVEGYCSPDCTRGLTRVEEYSREGREALGL